jgi:hypothetical protein
MPARYLKALSPRSCSKRSSIPRRGSSREKKSALDSAIVSHLGCRAKGPAEGASCHLFCIVPLFILLMGSNRCCVIDRGTKAGSSGSSCGNHRYGVGERDEGEVEAGCGLAELRTIGTKLDCHESSPTTLNWSEFCLNPSV